jgi:hypothetical protein
MRVDSKLQSRDGAASGQAGAELPQNLDGSEPPLGSWLVTPRRGYTHHGIYIGRNQVVHYAGLAHRWRRGPVEVVTVSEFSGGHGVGVRRTPSPNFDGALVAQRALSRIGENRYHILTNNCEHFCAWCVDGLSRSQQVERWLAPAVAALRAAPAALARFSMVLPRRASMASR